MGVRYVWGKYTAERKQQLVWRYRETQTTTDSGYSVSTGESSTVQIGSNYYFSKYSGNYTRTGLETYEISSGTHLPGGYLALSDGTLAYASEWIGGRSGSQYRVVSSGAATILGAQSYQEMEEYYAQGEFVNWMSADNRNGFSDGYSDGYYNVFQGQDNIDPVEVNIPASIRGGNTTNIQITPSTQKQYEGFVSYQYQYQADDGDWITLGNSASTSFGFKSPNNANKIKARARAQDDIGFSSTNWIESETATVIPNEPPSAPGSITVKNAISGQFATVTITPATDPDGDVTKYIFERQVDGGSWKKVSTTTNTLVYFEKIDEEWATVAYRACAVDNEDMPGPYVTSETIKVRLEYVVISGPDVDLGQKTGEFDLSVTIAVSDAEELLDKNIDVKIDLDANSIANQTINSGEKILLKINSRYLYAGSHHVQIHAEKEDHVAANADYVFEVPRSTQEILNRGDIVVYESPEGRVDCPMTFAGAVYCEDGKNLGTKIKEGLQLKSGSYIGTGNSGSESKNELVFSFAPRMLMLYRQDGAKMVVLAAETGESGESMGITFVMNETGVNWYANDPATQMNEAGTTYGFFAVGNWMSKGADTIGNIKKIARP